MIGQKAKDKGQPIEGIDIRSTPHRVNRGRISVPARVGALGALLSARPYGLGKRLYRSRWVPGQTPGTQRTPRTVHLQGHFATPASPGCLRRSLGLEGQHHPHLRLISARRPAAASPRAASSFVAAVTRVLVTQAAAFNSPHHQGHTCQVVDGGQISK